MEQKVHFIDALIRMPVTAEPDLIIRGFLNLIQPQFRAGVHRTLIDKGQKHLPGLVFVRAGVGEHHVYIVFPQLLLHIGFDFLGRLLVLPPAVTAHEAVVLVYAVCAADHEIVETVEGKDLAVLRKKQVRIGVLYPDLSALPICQMVALNMPRTHFMIAVDTQESRLQL